MGTEMYLIYISLVHFPTGSHSAVVKFVLVFFFNLGQFVLTWILECTCVSSAPVHLQHFVDKHCLYLYLQRNHQSNPETVLSRWNIGVGHEPLRQNKPHSTPHPRVHTKINPTETDPVEPLCMVYWKIPDWIPTDVPFDVFICLKTEWTNAPWATLHGFKFYHCPPVVKATKLFIAHPPSPHYSMFERKL